MSAFSWRRILMRYYGPDKTPFKVFTPDKVRRLAAIIGISNPRELVWFRSEICDVAHQYVLACERDPVGMDMKVRRKLYERIKTHSNSLRELIDQVTPWLSKDGSSASQPGHVYSPDSPDLDKVKEELEKLSRYCGGISTRLQANRPRAESKKELDRVDLPGSIAQGQLSAILGHFYRRLTGRIPTVQHSKDEGSEFERFAAAAGHIIVQAYGKGRKPPSRRDFQETARMLGTRRGRQHPRDVPPE